MNASIELIRALYSHIESVGVIFSITNEPYLMKEHVMKSLKAIFILAVMFGITACANLGLNLPSNDELLREYTEQNGKECIRDRDIRGFGVLDSDLISVDSRSRDEYYLMTTFFRCNSLDVSASIAFVGNFAEFCAGGSDKVYTGEEACPIKSIFKFESREQAFEAFDAITDKREQLRIELTEGK